MIIMEEEEFLCVKDGMILASFFLIWDANQHLIIQLTGLIMMGTILLKIANGQRIKSRPAIGENEKGKPIAKEVMSFLEKMST